MIYTEHGDIRMDSGEVILRDTEAWNELRKNNIIEPFIDYYATRRKTEFERNKITIESMVVALWERVIEDRPDSSIAIQLRRLPIKEGIKKL